jgi:hypothetical protein
MRWTIVCNPETGGYGVVSESALRTHLNNGWLQVGEWSKDPESLRALVDAEDGPPQPPTQDAEPQVTQISAPSDPADDPADEADESSREEDL